MTGPRIALFAEGGDWHAARLGEAFAARAAALVRLSLDRAMLATGTETGVELPGFDDGLPDAVLVKTVAAGSFEAITLRLGILHALRDLGVPVWNDARAIERCVDKAATSFHLARAGLPTPATWTTEDREAACRIVARECGQGPLVLKPLFGSQGRGLLLVERPEDLPPPEATGGVHYLQRLVRSPAGLFEDYRLFVVAGRVVAAMARRGATWITNVKQGGEPLPFAPDARMTRLAVAAAGAVGADYCGVDLIRDEAGQPLVLEVNSMPAWAGLQSVTPVDIAAAIADGLLAALPQRRQLAAAGG